MPEAGREQNAPSFALPMPRPCRFLTTVSDPGKAARELARVVRPGGAVATYMWEFPDGFPSACLAAAVKDLGLIPPERPNVQASARCAMQAIWKEAGLAAIETEEIRIRVANRERDGTNQAQRKSKGTCAYRR